MKFCGWIWRSPESLFCFWEGRGRPFMYCTDDRKGVANNSIWFVESTWDRGYKKSGDLYKNNQQWQNKQTNKIFLIRYIYIIQGQGYLTA